MQEQGGINLYAYVSGDPLGYVDLDGRFRRCRRPLDNFGGVVTSGRTGLNIGLYHEHGFYEDSSDSVGYSGEGLFDDRPRLAEYTCDNESYDDKRMRRAENNIRKDWSAEDYHWLKNNCQDFMDELFDEYNRLGEKK